MNRKRERERYRTRQRVDTAFPRYQRSLGGWTSCSRKKYSYVSHPWSWPETAVRDNRRQGQRLCPTRLFFASIMGNVRPLAQDRQLCESFRKRGSGRADFGACWCGMTSQFHALIYSVTRAPLQSQPPGKQNE